MVDASSHIRRGHPIVFGLLALFSFVVAVIASTLVTDFNKHNNAQKSSITGSVRFLLFTGWWTFAFSIVYLALFLTGKGGAFTSIAGHGIWIALTWLFFLAGAGAITASMGGAQNCGKSDLLYCTSMESLMAFSWISWILLTLMLIIVAGIGGTAFRGGRNLKEGLSSA
ncbi:hypothetical protein CBS101457_004727 [Exobasidium rhododendri]|nr:hypothetical protein CBS101457_004727 [Exobasidium rhododendri]